MSFKTITIKKEAYEALKSMKEPKESFSDILLRLSKKKRSLMSFAGMLSREQTAKLETSIKESRARHLSAHLKQTKRLSEAFNGQ